tara:strand:- start:2513 stop:2737 length:225 start_codon:yes stop_codon:yes gene_type:complete
MTEQPSPEAMESPQTAPEDYPKDAPTGSRNADHSRKLMTAMAVMVVWADKEENRKRTGRENNRPDNQGTASWLA